MVVINCTRGVQGVDFGVAKRDVMKHVMIFDNVKMTQCFYHRFYVAMYFKLDWIKVVGG